MVRFLNFLVAWIFEDVANILIILDFGRDPLPVLLIESFSARNQILVILIGHLEVHRFVAITH